MKDIYFLVLLVLKSVSYTHLDVYKRQRIYCGDIRIYAYHNTSSKVIKHFLNIDGKIFIFPQNFGTSRRIDTAYSTFREKSTRALRYVTALMYIVKSDL